MHDKPLTRDHYMDARWISEPLCLFDNCLETDGALAVVIVSAERARDLPQPPVYVHAFAQGIPRQHQMMTNYFNDDPLLGPSWACARRAVGAAPTFTPADVQVAQIYDAFSPLIPLSLEGYGFCGRGEGAAFTDDGDARVARRPAPDQHVGRRACRRRTSTASTWSSRACARSAARRRARSRAPTRAWSRAARACPPSALLLRR